MNLTLEIIESFSFQNKTIRPDWDDAGYEFTLPNGIVLTGYFMLNNMPCNTRALEGISGYIYIETKEELEELISKTYQEVMKEIKEKDPKFDIDEWRE